MNWENEILNTLFTPFIISLGVSLGIGLIVGMERELDNVWGKEHFAGMRAFAFMSMLGCLTTFLAQEFNPLILIVVSPTIFIFMSVFHYSKIRKENFGLVTELALLLVFFLGVASGLHYYKEALAVAVIATTLLTLKKQFREILKRITEEELYAFVKFIILTLLFLPFLPDKDLGPEGIFNPRRIGYIIVFVSSLSFVGYLVVKFFGARKGILFASVFGGIYSSTAVTWIYSKRSKENETLSTQYATGIIIASAVMHLRVLIISAFFNSSVFLHLLFPCMLMVLCNVILANNYIKQTSGTVTAEPIRLGNPLSINNALLFGLQYVVITLLVHYGKLYLGMKGLYITGILSGLGDMDAINISVSKLSRTEIQAGTAAVIILLATISNTFFKLGQTYIMGTNVLCKKVSGGLIPSLVVAILSILYECFIF